MNENVSIKEGNITRKFAPIDKVKVDNTDGTSSIWVPEDDLKTGVLYASENGIYIASEDGYDAYSEVVIRIEKRIDDGDLIDESGTDWKDIDFDGDVGNFDELDNWDVDTLEEFSDDLEGFDDLFNDEDKWDEEKEKPITEDEMGDFDGDSISGIDPETGNEMEVSLDEDGFLDEELLPSDISIIREPFKLKYIDGEMIQYAGLMVQAYTEDGNVWTDGSHPNGIIPLSELVFTVHKAVFSQSEGDEYEIDELGITACLNPISVGSVISSHYYEDSGVTAKLEVTSVSGEGVYLINCGDDENGYSAFMVSKNPFSVTWKRNVWSPNPTTWNGSENTYENYTAYISPIMKSNDNWANQMGTTGYYGDLNALAVLAVNTGREIKQCTQNVPVYWMRDDGDVLSDSFAITVYKNDSDDGKDSSWDGNISYGGNDYMLNPNSVVGLSYDPKSKQVIAPNIGEYKVDQAIDVGLLIPKE